jgi:hypothetical protein
MKRILGLAIASLIAFPSTALAADLVLVSEASDGTRIFVDNESYAQGFKIFNTYENLFRASSWSSRMIGEEDYERLLKSVRQAKSK